MSKVAELMATGPITVQAGDKVNEVAQRMASNQVGAVLVVSGDELVGVFSERDLAVRVIAEGKDPTTTAVGDVATTEVISVAPDDGIRAALERFHIGKFRHLPVVENGKPVGILSTRDLLVTALDRLERFIEQAGYDRETAAGADPYDHFGGGYGK